MTTAVFPTPRILLICIFKTYYYLISFRVRDGKWGGVVNGKWNGLVAELMNHETDMVMTSLKINSGREKVIDFSVPYLETGITILGNLCINAFVCVLFLV